jgi:hypothetical protein
MLVMVLKWNVSYIINMMLTAKRGTLYPQKMAVTSPTSSGRSVGIVHSRTQTMEFFVCFFVY